MADVTISYGGQTITSLSDSGTEVLETSGTFLTDDITIDYVKSGGGGGGGGTKSVHINLAPLYLTWVDGNGTAHKESYLQAWPTRECLSGSLIIFAYTNPPAQQGWALAVTNALSFITIDHGNRANPRYTCVYQVE